MRQRTSRANEGGEGDDFGSTSDNTSFGGHQSYHSTLGQMAEKVKSGGGSGSGAGGGTGSSSVGAYDMGDDGNEEDDDEFDPSICAPGSEHTGRWTRKEHELFLEALKKYGKVCQDIFMSSRISTDKINEDMFLDTTTTTTTTTLLLLLLLLF